MSLLRPAGSNYTAVVDTAAASSWYSEKLGLQNARAGVFEHPQQGRGHSLLPALRQRWTRLLFVAVGLLHNVGGGRLGLRFFSLSAGPLA